MAELGERRRLAAIFAADMVGYSRLMEADEQGTIARHKVHRTELIDPKIAEHHGRIVKTTGDGMLVEFASVVDAVECAVAIQRAMAERERDVSEERRFQYRVGINLGDIVIEGDDIFGDGVNIAARLEEMAASGGICISGTAYDQLKRKVDVGYEFLGEQKVKNIETPVPVYRVLLAPEAAGQDIGESRQSRPRWRFGAVAAGGLAVVVVAAVWWRPWVPTVESASVERIDLLFLGDTSFGENYQERRAEKGDENVLETRGYDHLIEPFGDMLGAASLVIANLETPITDLRASPLEGIKTYLHYADVDETPRYLSKYEFGLVSLANNHSLDFGMPGLDQTLARLAERDIETCGAGKTEAEARRPFVRAFPVGGSSVRIAVLCAFEYQPRYARDFTFYANGAVGGVNRLSAEVMATDIQALRKRHDEVFVVAFLHWGKNYRLVTDRQRRLGHALIDAGADLIVGHGAHLLQELEHYRGRWIVYGLGNFVFASPGRYAKLQAHPYSMIARLRLAGREGSVAKTLRLYPILTDNKVTGYRSRFVNASEFDEVRTLLSRHSAVATGFDAVALRGRDAHGWYVEVELD